MKTLVFLEHHAGAIGRDSLGLLALAGKLGGGGAAVLVGNDEVRNLAEIAGRFGASAVHLAVDAGYDPPLPQQRIDVLETIVTAGGYDTVLFANSVLAADVAAALAVRLRAGLNWDLIGLEQDADELVGTRLALGDAVLARVGWTTAVRVALFRGGSFEAAPEGTADAAVSEETAPHPPQSERIAIVEQELQSAEGPALEDAEVIVAGGRGLGSPENFALAEDLAGALGGAVGATRAVVYARWYPASTQIGQTGKTVSPKLYVTLGISGATQHKVGMQNSKTIVAINKDPNAPIFDISDLGVVGDLHTIVPRLTELVRERKGS